MRIIPNTVKMTTSRRVISLTVIMEESDDRIRNESDFFYRLKNLLIEKGHDVIKKLMWKDGHMVDERIHYVRSRKTEGPGSYMIWDSQYQLRDLSEDMNREGSVILAIDGDFPVPPRTVLDWRPRN